MVYTQYNVIMYLHTENARITEKSDGNQKSLLQLASGFRVFRIGRGATSTSNRGQVREQEGAIRLFNVFQSRYASLE